MHKVPNPAVKRKMRLYQKTILASRRQTGRFFLSPPRGIVCQKKIKIKEKTSMKKSPIVTVVAIGIGAALFFVLARFVAIPSPVPNTNISIQYGLLAFMAALFGPVAGLLIGLIGHALIDFSYGWGIWWSWVIASAVFGCLMGLLARKVRLADGEFSKKDFLGFLLAVVIGHAAAWFVIAPVLDIVMYAEPVNKVFVQGLVAGLANIVTTAIVGGLLCAAYAAAKPKKGSLKEEK
jgi:energy-coupling factor transport system substrate-specific component